MKKIKQTKKNVYITIQLYSSHMPARLCSISFMLGFSSTWTNVQAGFRKGRGSKDQIANIRWVIEKAGKKKQNLLLFH